MKRYNLTVRRTDDPDSSVAYMQPHPQGSYVEHVEVENELNACIDVATEAITHAGMDMTTVLYILGNLSARKLNSTKLAESA